MRRDNEDDPNAAYTRTWIPPPPDSQHPVHPAQYITRKTFVKQRNIEDLEEDKEASKNKKRRVLREEEGEDAGLTSAMIYQKVLREMPSQQPPQRFFCEECNIFVTISVALHLRSVPHLFSTGEKPTKKYFLTESNKGYQMLKAMAWTEDQGLGAQGQGQLDPIRTVLKSDRKGLGLGEEKARITHFDAGMTKPKGENDHKQQPSRLTKPQKRLLEQKQKKKEQRIYDVLFRDEEVLMLTSGHLDL